MNKGWVHTILNLFLQQVLPFVNVPFPFNILYLITNFHLRRWGSLLPVLRTLDPPLNPHQHKRNFFGAHVSSGMLKFVKYSLDFFTKALASNSPLLAV
jgi:hypothetical protein